MRILLGLVLACALASATVYYVAKNGNDGNPGTAAQPWLTINHMASNVHAGDTCWVKQGTYDEHLVYFENVGTTAHPISILSYDGYNTVMHTPWIVAGPHYYISGFKFIMSTSDTLDGAWNCVKFDTRTYPADSCTIRKCLLTSAVANTITGCGIQIGHRQGVVVESCETYGWGQYGQSMQGHGIYVQGSHGAVRWCKSHDNIGVGIHEYFESGSESGISGNEIAYNLCYNSIDGHSGIIVKSDSDLVHDNITYENVTGIFVYYGNSAHNHFYNNTSYNDYEGFYDGASTGGPNVYRNNVIIGKASSVLVTRTNANDSLDYNCYFPDGATKFTYYTSGGNVEHDTNFTAWKSGTGQDAHSICTNPLVTDTAGHNFHLTASSPCIDKGWPSTPSSHDFDGLAYSGSSTDLGALQYEAGTSDSLDAGVLTIFTPSGTVDSGVVVKCSTTVHNYGTKTISPTVKLTVSTYKDSATVTNLTAGSSAVVNFTNWTPLVCGTFAVTCSTRLANDQNTANDKASGSVIVASVAPPASSGKSHYPLTRKSGAVKANVGKVK